MPRSTLVLAPLLLGLLAAAPAMAATGPWQENDASSVRLVSPWGAAPREGELVLGLEFRLAPGWHVYWKNSGSAGYPPSIDLSPTPALGEAEILWPAPERYDLRGGLVAFGYHDHVIYPVRTTIAAGPEAGEVLEIAADVDYVVCEEDCIPYSYRLTLTQPLAGEGAEPVPAEEDRALLASYEERVPAAVEALPGVTSTGRLDLSASESPRLLVTLEGVPAGPEPQIFFEPQELFEVGRPEVAQSGPDGVSFVVPLTPRQAGEPIEQAELAWTMTGLADPPAVEARRTVSAGAGMPEGVRTDGGPAAGTGWLWTILGGLLLHLSPALLAVLVAQVLAWRQLAAVRVRRRALATALGVVAGMAGVAGVARVLDLPLAWGLQFQEPAWMAFLAVVALLLALNLWGLLDLPLSPKTGGGLLAGVVVALLALPWNLPYLDEALAATPVPWALSALTLGLALPYLLLAALPAVVAHPGGSNPAASTRLRQALGFAAAVAMLWLLYLLTRRLPAEGLAVLELGLVGLGLLAWWHRVARARWLSVALGLALLLLAALLPWLSAPA